MKNEYIAKIGFNIKEQEEEILMGVLQEELGYQPSIYQEPLWDFVQIQFYVPLDQENKALEEVKQLLQDLEDLHIIEQQDHKIHSTQLKEEDWMNHWKQYFTPILVGENLQITPFWYPLNPDRKNLIIEPKMGFGTGQHPTTFLCLESLVKEDLLGKNILDLGAGSGILGVSSALLGANQVLLLEIEPLSIEACEDTVERNQVQDKVSILNRDVFKLEEQFYGPYDLAMINIIAEVIVDILELPWIQNIPTLYLSGILEIKKDQVIQAVHKKNWTIIEEKQLGDWIFLKVLTHHHNM